MRYVLFVCTHNAGRSQIAQAFFEKYAPEDLRAESAGSAPADAVWPEVVEVMRESGIDISGRTPRKLDLEMQLHADWAITMHCEDTCPYVPGVVEDWDVEDPAGKPLEVVRAIRDDIEARVKRLIEEHADDIRADRTAHARRLERLLPQLVKEFDGSKTPEEIRACTDAVLERFDDAPVRSFVEPLALRTARDCLSAESCELVPS
jgi:arsenate reductase (thioredoxin)